MDVLSGARKTISQDRMDQYGKPEDSFAIISALWLIYLMAKFKTGEGDYRLDLSSFSKKDVGIMMALFKIARMVGQTESVDNYIDAIGYLTITAERLADFGGNNGTT